VNSPMKPQEAITLQAFLVALSQLDETLPPELLQGIRQIGAALALHQAGAIASISSLVKQNIRWQQLYELAWMTLQRQCQNHEQTRQLLVKELPEEVAIALEDTTAQLLTTDDPQTTAHIQFTQVKAHQDLKEAAATEPQAFWNCLYRTVSLIEEQSHTVLRALERRPLNVENLCYILQLPVSQVKALVQYLWSTGYIDQTTGGLLHKIFPRWRRVQNASAIELPPQTQANPGYFTLTAKGHFHLHPLVTADRRESTPL
jgi:hypothetical protein